MFYRLNEAPGVQMLPGLIRRTLVSGKALMICRFDLEIEIRQQIFIAAGAGQRRYIGAQNSGKVII